MELDHSTVFPSTNSLATSHFFVVAAHSISFRVAVASVPDNTPPHPLKVDTCPQQQRITMATTPVTDPFLACSLAATRNPPPMFGPGAAPATPDTRIPPVPSIPRRSPTHPSGFSPGADAAPKVDHDTDSLASFLAWRSPTHHIENVNQTVKALLGPICQFVRAEMKHRLANQSTTIKILGL